MSAMYISINIDFLIAKKNEKLPMSVIPRFVVSQHSYFSWQADMAYTLRKQGFFPNHKFVPVLTRGGILCCRYWKSSKLAYRGCCNPCRPCNPWNNISHIPTVITKVTWGQNTVKIYKTSILCHLNRFQYIHISYRSVHRAVYTTIHTNLVHF